LEAGRRASWIGLCDAVTVRTGTGVNIFHDAAREPSKQFRIALDRDRMYERAIAMLADEREAAKLVADWRFDNSYSILRWYGAMFQTNPLRFLMSPLGEHFRALRVIAAVASEHGARLINKSGGGTRGRSAPTPGP